MSSSSINQIITSTFERNQYKIRLSLWAVYHGLVIGLLIWICATTSGPGRIQNVTQFPSKHPTKNPTLNPTFKPTKAPTKFPSKHPTKFPTKHPTKNPTIHPTKNPTLKPTIHPTKNPTKNPTKYPTPPTKSPTKLPTRHPTPPTKSPTKHPTKNPTPPTKTPTKHPTQNPTQASERLIIFTSLSTTVNGNLGSALASSNTCIGFGLPATCSSVFALVSYNTTYQIANFSSIYNFPLSIPVYGSNGVMISTSWANWINISQPLVNSYYAANLIDPSGAGYQWCLYGSTTSATVDLSNNCNQWTSNSAGNYADIGWLNNYGTTINTFLNTAKGTDYAFTCDQSYNLLCGCYTTSVPTPSPVTLTPTIPTNSPTTVPTERIILYSSSSYITNGNIGSPQVSSSTCATTIGTPAGANCASVFMLISYNSSYQIANYSTIYNFSPSLGVYGPTGVLLSSNWTTWLSTSTHLINSYYTAGIVSNTQNYYAWKNTCNQGIICNSIYNCNQWTSSSDSVNGYYGDWPLSSLVGNYFLTASSNDYCSNYYQVLCACHAVPPTKSPTKHPTKNPTKNPTQQPRIVVFATALLYGGNFGNVNATTNTCKVSPNLPTTTVYPCQAIFPLLSYNSSYQVSMYPSIYGFSSSIQVWGEDGQLADTWTNFLTSSYTLLNTWVPVRNLGDYSTFVAFTGTKNGGAFQGPNCQQWTSATTGAGGGIAGFINVLVTENEWLSRSQQVPCNTEYDETYLSPPGFLCGCLTTPI